MNCKACRIEIEEAEACAPVSARARSHAETCQSCGAFLVERRSLRQLVGSLETVTAPPDFDFRLRARLAAARSADHRMFAWQRFVPHAFPAMAFAALLALVVGVPLIFQQVNLNRRDDARPTEAVANVPAREGQPGQVVSAPPSVAPVESSGEDTAAHHNDNARRNLTAVSRRSAGVDALPEREPGVEPDRTATTTNDAGIRSIDFGALRPAPQLYPTGISNPAVDPNPAIIVPVRVLAQPAKFLFDEGRGTTSSTFSLRNVTFGSERLIESGEPSGINGQDATDIW
jgi:hypothetical protein